MKNGPLADRRNPFARSVMKSVRYSLEKIQIPMPENRYRKARPRMREKSTPTPFTASRKSENPRDAVESTQPSPALLGNPSAGIRCHFADAIWSNTRPDAASPPA